MSGAQDPSERAARESRAVCLRLRASAAEEKAHRRRYAYSRRSNCEMHQLTRQNRKD